MRALTVGPSSLGDALADLGWEVDVAYEGFDYMLHERSHYDLLHAAGEDVLHQAFELMLRFPCKWILEAPSEHPLMSDMTQWYKRENLWSNLETDFSTDITAHVQELFSAQTSDQGL